MFIAYRLVGPWLSDPYVQHLAATHVSLDGLALGVGLRALREYRPALFALLGRGNWLWILAGICMVPIKPGVIPFPALAATMILLGTVHLRPTGRLAQAGRPVVRLIGWIGLHSYSTYLWHVTFLGIVRDKVLSHIESTRHNQWAGFCTGPLSARASSCCHG